MDRNGKRSSALRDLRSPPCLTHQDVGTKGWAVAEMTQDVSVPIVGGRPQENRKMRFVSQYVGTKGWAVAEVTRDVSVPIIGGRPQGNRKIR
ncbi:hypothetical protein NDU88_000173 [Pleurodeles waltl]|uniref:Uncharacterized protein n=1 Tax=Pleurodeles waltl TaxID=8319 RepID=A0AAV7KLL3_PLEWA|nr:hypothetical protein NDU88_000173 [Pleurodeles waltl]